jgi:hypothetical protein
MMVTHARLWRRLPSPYGHIETFGSSAGPFNYVVTHNFTSGVWTASVKRRGEGDDEIAVVGMFRDATAAYEACEKHYRGALS